MSGAVLGECPLTGRERGLVPAFGLLRPTLSYPLSPLRSSCFLWPPGQHCHLRTLGPFSGYRNGGCKNPSFGLGPGAGPGPLCALVLFVVGRTQHGPPGMEGSSVVQAWMGVMKEH